MSETKRKYTRKKQKQSAAFKLIESLKFIFQVLKKQGSLQQTHCKLVNKWLLGANDKVTLATKIDEDLNCSPHAHTFIEALSKCSGVVKIVFDGNALSVQSENFKAIVDDCTNLLNLSFRTPSECQFVVPEHFIKCIQTLSKLLSQTSEEIWLNSILIGTNSCVASNGSVLIEIVHGGYFESSFIINHCVGILSKTDKTLVKYTIEANQITFEYEDGSLLISELENEIYPPYSHHFDYEGELINCNLTEEFFKALEYIKPFSVQGVVYFNEGKFCSNENETESTSYEISGYPSGFSFYISDLLLLKDLDGNAFFDRFKNKIFLYSKEGVLPMYRCVALGISKPEENGIENESA